MNRRGFLKFLGGGAAVGAVAAVAPSQVWPFTKIFLPQTPTRWVGVDFGSEPAFTAFRFAPINEAAVQAAELETFARQIPYLLYENDPMYAMFVSKNRIDILDKSWGKRPAFRIPVGKMRMSNESQIVLEPADDSLRSAEPTVAVSEVLSSLDRDVRHALTVRR